jgi:ArsR family transcriptional regulator
MGLKNKGGEEKMAKGTRELEEKVVDIEDPREEIFEALAHFRRILILEQLKDGEKCASELIPALGVDQSAVSRHLSILKKSGLIASRKVGVNVYFSIADGRVFKILELATEIARDRNVKILEKLKV